MSRSKIVKQGKDQPTEVEQKVSQALMELEQNSSDLKQQLRELYIHGAKVGLLITIRRNILNKIMLKVLKYLKQLSFTHHYCKDQQYLHHLIIQFI